jgi:outer membrane biosynthesis protein TonB
MLLFALSSVASAASAQDLSYTISANDGGRTGATTVRIPPAIQSALGNEIMRQIKPHWSMPSRRGVDSIKTALKISLARDGTVTDIQVLGSSGVNDSNRSIVSMHQKRAIKAVRLASPFRLPEQYYDVWKNVAVNFDWSLK